MIARSVDVPRDALLARYTEQEGAYTDCFEVMHPLETTLPSFIAAFYTTPIFRMERLVLTIALRQRITDDHVIALAKGADSFAAWTVEDSAPNQLLLRDEVGGTRSYLAVAPKDGGVTRLLFGSAVVARQGNTLPAPIRAMIPLHRFYSRLLLRSAERRLRRIPPLDPAAPST